MFFVINRDLSAPKSGFPAKTFLVTCSIVYERFVNDVTLKSWFGKRGKI